MNLQFDNKILSSFLLHLDYTLLNNGGAYTNYSGLLYPSTGRLYGLNIYSTPYRQLVNDVSITGASIMSGIYVSGSFLQPGTSGLNSINITEGQAYFTNSPSSVSGVFAVKDFNIYLNNRPEVELLFETKLWVKPKVPQTLTGLPQDTETCPAIFLHINNGENEPFCLGGGENSKMFIRAIVLSDSLMMTDAACSVLKNMAHKYFKIIEPTGLPFNSYGAYTGVNYNYTGLIDGATDQSLIWSAKMSNLSKTRTLNQLNPSIFAAFVDFELWTFLN